MNSKILLVGICFLGACSTLPKKHSLSEKLDAQWANYTSARNLLLKRIDDSQIPLEKKTISRSEWEEKIALKNSYAILPEDLAQLKTEQNLRIELARKLSYASSEIDLNLVRKTNQSKKFCAKFPKGGMLHIHPNGTLTAESIHRLLKLQNPLLPPEDFVDRVESDGASLLSEEVAWLNSFSSKKKFNDLSARDQKRFENLLVLPKGHQEFTRFNAVFNFIGMLPSEVNVYEEAIESFAKRALREGVIYVELTGHVTPGSLKLVEKIQNETGLMIRINRSFNRTESIAELDRKWKRTLLLPPNPFLVGIDLLDNEDANGALEKGQLLYASALSAKIQGKTDLHRTMHAGELGDSRNARDAIIMGTERLGHGVLLEKDAVALEYASRIKMPIEVNLSSNLRLTSAREIKSHPFLKF